MNEGATGDTVTVDGPHAGVVEVRLNRPSVKNALNMPMRRSLAQVFRDIADDDDVRCVVLTGGQEAFAAGADIQDMVDASAVDMYLRHNERLWKAIAECPQPVIAAVEGYALGGGLELAMHADIIIAGEGARLGQPEVNVGIMPGAGGTQRLTRAVGKFQAMRLLLTGRPVKAPEAFTMGLVSQVVADGSAVKTSHETAAVIAGLPPIAVAQVKEVVLHGGDASLEAGLAMERKAMQLLFASEDQREGMVAFKEKRQPLYKGR